MSRRNTRYDPVYLLKILALFDAFLVLCTLVLRISLFVRAGSVRPSALDKKLLEFEGSIFTSFVFFAVAYLYLRDRVGSPHEAAQHRVGIDITLASFELLKRKFGALNIDVKEAKIHHPIVSLSFSKQLVLFSHSSKNYQIPKTDFIELLSDFFKSKSITFTLDDSVFKITTLCEFPCTKDYVYTAVLEKALSVATVVEEVVRQPAVTQSTQPPIQAVEKKPAKTLFFETKPYSNLVEAEKYIAGIKEALSSCSTASGNKLDSAKRKLTSLTERAELCRKNLESLKAKSDFCDSDQQNSEELIRTIVDLVAEAKNYLKDENSQLNELIRFVNSKRHSPK